MATRFLSRSVLASTKQSLNFVFSRSSSSFLNPSQSLSTPSFSLLRLRPLVAVVTNFSPVSRSSSFRGFATRQTSSSLSDPNPNFSNRPPKETILLDGCDFEHWLVVMEKPEGDPTRDEIIDSYIKTLAQIVGSEEEARMKIYSVSTRHYFAFGALVSEELSYKLKELPRVRWVLPDSYLDVKNKDYGGEPFINGQAVPYDPKYHEEWVRNNARANERNRRNDRPRNFDRSRNFERRREMQNTGGGPPGGQYNTGGGPNVGGMPQRNNMGGMPPPNNMGGSPNMGGMPPPNNMGGSPNMGGMPPNNMGRPPNMGMPSGNLGGPPNMGGMPSGNMGGPPNMGGMSSGNMGGPPNMVGMPSGNMGGPPDMGGMPPSNMGGPPNMGGMQGSNMGGPPYLSYTGGRPPNMGGMPGSAVNIPQGNAPNGGGMPYQSGPGPNQYNANAPNTGGGNPYQNQNIPERDMPLPPNQNYQ